VLTVWNKADIALPPEDAGRDFCPVSAKTGYGLDALCGRIADTLVKAAGAEAGGMWSGAGLGSARQKALIDAAAEALEAALAAHDEGLPADLIAPFLREAVDRLGEITGEVSSADILETMFSRFCVGK
jgi:tRNA modification GTPase